LERRVSDERTILDELAELEAEGVVRRVDIPYEAVPAELRLRAQWVVWRTEQRDGEATKVPYRPAQPERRASSSDVNSWGTFAQALAVLEQGKADGLGFAFSADDPYTGIDLDKCRDPETGLLEAEAAAVVQRLDSYSEVSPSGTGVHVILRATVPGQRRRRGSIEMYDSGRFFTVTGAHVTGTPATVEPRQEELHRLYETTFARTNELSLDTHTSPAPELALPDEELLEVARRARNAATFERLWSGDTSAYASASEADLALVDLLAFYAGPDPAAIDRLFRQSGLMRDKWQREDYREATIGKALAGRTEFYTPPRPSSGAKVEEESPGPPAPPPPERFELPVLTARELCALPDPPAEDQLLGPLVVRRYRTIVGGATGHGKTEFVLALVHALVEGGEFLGFDCAGGHRVLILDLEQGEVSAKIKLRRAKLAESDLVDYVRWPDGLALDRNLQHVAAVETLLQRGKYAAVALDPHYKAHLGESNSEREVVDLCRRLDAWRTKHGFALILPVHTRKPAEPGSKLTIHDLFGSSALTRGAEVVLGLELKAPGYSRLHFFKDRDGLADLPTGGEPWGLLFDREHGFRRDPTELEPELDIPAALKTLGEDGKWRTLDEWSVSSEGGIGKSRKVVRPVLEELVEEGSFDYSEDAEEHGRHPNSKCWRITPPAAQGGWSRQARPGQGNGAVLPPHHVSTPRRGVSVGGETPTPGVQTSFAEPGESDETGGEGGA
jgi:putative DNA primase/helicase